MDSMNNLPDNPPHILIIGAGGAGTALALALKDKGLKGTIWIVSSADPRQTSTYYAQGGIAVVVDVNDSNALHIQDTLVAGDGLCNVNAVNTIISKGPEAIRWLLSKGLTFDKNPETGHFELGLEGGHSRSRILHIKDHTGKDLLSFLYNKLQQPTKATTQVFILHKFDVLRIRRPKSNRLWQVDMCDINSGTLYTIHVPVVVIATGGIGALFKYTSNPPEATGSGIFLGKIAGATLRDIHFIQFHPTGLYMENKIQLPLLTEALRGAGAKLRNYNGDIFMHKYHERAELAPRDIVSRAIISEMKKTGTNHIWLDATNITDWNRFPQVYHLCKQAGIDPAKQWIPIIPVAHYMCGGIHTDTQGKTVLPGLFATGECACTGLHGANRLASNSLLELLVMSMSSVNAIESYIKSTGSHRIQYKVSILGKLKTDNSSYESILHTIEWLRELLYKHVGVIKDSRNMQELRKLIAKELTQTPDLREIIESEHIPWSSLSEARLTRILYSALWILDASIRWKENRGTFFKVTG